MEVICTVKKLLKCVEIIYGILIIIYTWVKRWHADIKNVLHVLMSATLASF
jgi:hypothetical protein